MMSEPAVFADTDAIRADLEYMTARWGELDVPALFELRAFKEDCHPQNAKFSPDWIDDAVEWCESMNEIGFNIYVVRNPIRHDGPRSASDADIIAAFFLWADCDDEDSASNVKRFSGPKYSAAVTTGRTPSVRVHVYWQLEQPCTDMAAWRDMQTRIAAHFNSDRAVVNPSRIMRVGGTVAFPAKHKVDRGYTKELTTIRTQYDDTRAPVTMEQMDRVFASAPQGTTQGHTGALSVDVGPHRKDAEEYADILRQARTDGEKHNGVRGLSASLAGSGVPRSMAEAIIREACPVWDKGVEGLINTAYDKFYNPEPKVRSAEEIEGEQSESGDWQEMLVRNKRGRAIWNTANALIMMEHDEALKDCFAYDEFKQIKMMTSPLPFSGDNPKTFKGRELRDSDITKLVAYFNRIGFPDASKTVAADAMQARCESSTFHPVKNYLNTLPEWDGVERISHWLKDYCAADCYDDDHELYVQQIGRRWLISCVARIMRPGCKADGVLILEGQQGSMKSTTLRTLAGAEWFGDSLPSLHSKDASDYLRGKWIVEMAELSNINKSEVEVVKAFIAREEERFRPAYGRNEITYPRQCVFAGSTNKTDYLRDETGNRRFWPVKVGNKCDVEGLIEDRDQLWSEAVHAFKSGEIWWLTGNAEEIAKHQQEERVAQDAWEGTILQFIENMPEVSLTEIATKALDIETGRVDRASSNRITAVLAANGWRRSGQFTYGENKGRAKYVKGENA